MKLGLLVCLIVGLIVGCSSESPKPRQQQVSSGQAPDKPIAQVEADRTVQEQAAEMPASSTGDDQAAATSQSGRRAIIEMANGGEIEIEFYEDDSPNTVENFCGLAKKGFYDGLTFHRVIPNFVAQGGCPKGDGTGDPGYKIPSEFNNHKHVRGTVAMARSQDPDSAGCQFYICYGDIPHLDNQYTVFGQVVRGMDVVDKFTVTEPGRGIAGDKMKTIRVIE